MCGGVTPAAPEPWQGPGPPRFTLCWAPRQFYLLDPARRVGSKLKAHALGAHAGAPSATPVDPPLEGSAHAPCPLARAAYLGGPRLFRLRHGYGQSTTSTVYVTGEDVPERLTV